MILKSKYIVNMYHNHLCGKYNQWLLKWMADWLNEWLVEWVNDFQMGNKYYSFGVQSVNKWQVGLMSTTFTYKKTQEKDNSLRKVAEIC